MQVSYWCLCLQRAKEIKFSSDEKRKALEPTLAEGHVPLCNGSEVQVILSPALFVGMRVALSVNVYQFAVMAKRYSLFVIFGYSNKNGDYLHLSVSLRGRINTLSSSYLFIFLWIILFEKFRVTSNNHFFSKWENAKLFFFSDSDLHVFSAVL